MPCFVPSREIRRSGARSFFAVTGLWVPGNFKVGRLSCWQSEGLAMCCLNAKAELPPRSGPRRASNRGGSTVRTETRPSGEFLFQASHQIQNILRVDELALQLELFELGRCCFCGH